MDNNLVSERDDDNSYEIISIPKLEDFLVSLKDKENETALSYAIQAQLKVLEVIQSPEITISIFDLFLELLDTSIKLTENKIQKNIIQQKSAVMINSMVFFMEAKICYENKKWTEEGLDLLKQGCNMLADSIPVIANMVITKGKSIAVDGKQLYDNLLQDRTFLNRIISYFSGEQEKKVRKMKKDFRIFMLDLLNKLCIYKELFGRSILLAELFKRYFDRYSNTLLKPEEMPLLNLAVVISVCL